MKKLLLASLASVCAISAVHASFLGIGLGRGGSNCAQGCATSCAPAQASCASQSVKPPECYKEVTTFKQVPVKQSVRVPARMIKIKQPPVITRKPDTKRYIRKPQPPIERPDKLVCLTVPGGTETYQPQDVIRYECPAGTTSTPCSPVCASTCEQSCAPAC